MNVFERMGAIALIAVLTFAAGLSSPYPARAQELAPTARTVHSPAPRASAPIIANRVDPRLEANSAHLDRITRLLRGRLSDDVHAAARTQDELRLAGAVHEQLQGVGGLELALQQSAVNERADMARLQIPDQVRQRFETQDRTLAQRARDFRVAANQLESALASANRSSVHVALDALAKVLDTNDVTRRTAFDPDSLRAQRVRAERRAPATTFAALQRFLDRRPSGNAKTLDPAAAPGASLMAASPSVALSPELTGSHETQISPEIQTLADALGRNPVRIYNWVRNEIDFVPTHGAIQGAALTLRNRQGNAADTNSLLAALLRASGIPVRFVYGTVDVPVDQALSWLKASNIDDAINQIQIGGIPSTLLKLNGQAYALRLQHLWIEAYIDFTPSRGAVNRTPDAWIPLDASFKQYQQIPVLDLPGLGQWNETEAANALKQGAQFNADGSFTGLNTTAYTAYRQQVIGRIDQATDISALADPARAPGSYHVVASQLPVISGTLPFAVSAASTRFAAIPDGLKFFVEANLYRYAQDIAYENPELTVRLATVDLDGQSLYVDYVGATDTDSYGLQSYATSNAASLPLGSFNVVPTVKLGSQVLGQGGAVGMGAQQYWTVGVQDVQGHVTGSNQPYQFAAGSRISFTPDLGGVSDALAESAVHGLADTVDLPIDQALHLAGIQYWALNDGRARQLAQFAGGHFLRMPSVGAFAAPMQVRYFFGIPRTGYFAGYATDVKADRVGIAHVDPSVALRLAAQLGANGSLSEGLTWDLLLNGHAGKSLSSMSILAWANRSHVPIYTITADNIGTVLPKIQTTSDVLDEIRNAVAAGFQVIIPEREFSQGNVQAAGYVILDPETGTGVYRVDGGLNGAINWGCIAKALVLKVLCSTKFIAVLKERVYALGARFFALAEAQALLTVMCPPLGAALAVVDAVVLTLTIIQVAYEITTWVKQIEEGLDNLTLEDMATMGVKAINDYACNYLPGCLGSVPGAQAVNGWFSRTFLGYDPADASPNGRSEGNPVTVGNGVKTQIEPDYAGEGPFPLEYTRTYLSYLPNGSPVGHKWLATYQQRLVLPDGATAMTAPEAVMAQRPDGGWQQYNYRSGTYVTNGDHAERIERITDGLARTTGWRLYTLDDTTESYDADGRLLLITNRTGLKHTLAYASTGQLQQVSDDFGRSLRFEHDATTRQITAMIDPENRRTSYAYESGTLVKVTRPDSTFRIYHYETPGWPTLLTGITDERGIRFASWKYDDENRAIESTHANGADKVSFAYGLNETTVTDARGTARTYKFTRINETLRMTEATQPCSTCSAGGTSKIQYDGNGFPALITDFRGNQTQVRVNSRGLPEQWTQALGTPEARTISVQWHPTWRLPATITEPAANGGSRMSAFEYDARGNLAKRTVTADGESRVWTYGNNSAGQVTQVDGPRTDVSDITRYEYESTTGNRTAVIDANGLTTRFTRFDAHGHVLQMVDPNGLTTDYRYDPRDRLIESKETAPGRTSETTAYRYNAVGLLERLTMPDGSALSYTYDDAQRLVAVEDTLGNRVDYALNDAGDRVREDTRDSAHVLAQTTSRVFDSLGRLHQAYGPDPAEARLFGYDANGNQLSALAPLHANATQNGYDPLNRLTSTVDPALGLVAYRYDAQSNLRQVTDPRGLATKYDYDGRNELTALTSPDTGVTRYGYDAASNLTSRVDARNVGATYAYDAGNRLKSIIYPDEALTYSYDEASGGAGAGGRLTTQGDASGRTHFEYDYQGRVVQKTQQLGSEGNAAGRRSLGYSYANGRVQEARLPSGTRLSYLYGADGRVREIGVNGQSVVRSIEYAPFGVPKSWVTSAGTYQRGIDQTGRIVSHTMAGATTQLRYDTAGRTIAKGESISGRPSWTYRYDDLDQIKHAANASSSGPLAAAEFDWQYDASGNRTTQAKTSGPTSLLSNYLVEPTSNRLSSIGGSARQYDATGSATLVNGQSWVYSGRKRAVEVRLGASVQARFAYNGFGERVCVATNAGTCPSSTSAGLAYSQFVYDENGHLVGEYDSAGNLVAEHVWLGDTPVAELRPASQATVFGLTVSGSVAIAFVHPDHLDTPRSVINAAGQAIWRWDSAPFGETPADENPSGMGQFAYSLRFPGQQFDSITSTHYNYYRDYEAATGRYVESDPIGLEGGLNTFSYVSGQPLAYFDTQGLAAGKGFPGLDCGPCNKKHKNSRDYNGPTHVYVITDTRDGSLLKVGKGSGPGSLASVRCESQAALLNSKPGSAGRFKCEIRQEFCGTGDALDYERKLRDRLRELGNALPGNREGY